MPALNEQEQTVLLHNGTILTYTIDGSEIHFNATHSGVVEMFSLSFNEISALFGLNAGESLGVCNAERLLQGSRENNTIVLKFLDNNDSEIGMFAMPYLEFKEVFIIPALALGNIIKEHENLIDPNINIVTSDGHLFKISDVAAVNNIVQGLQQVYDEMHQMEM